MRDTIMLKKTSAIPSPKAEATMLPPLTNGDFLRRLRKSRRLTLLQVEQLTGISISVLSRLERNERNLTRSDCLQLSRVYELNTFETLTLFSKAGFLPDDLPHFDESAARKQALSLVAESAFPALLSDHIGMVLEWNGGLQEMWGPPQHRPVHILEGLFLKRVRAQLGEAWHSFVVTAMRNFAYRTLALSQDSNPKRLFGLLEAEHREEMVALWNEAISGLPGNSPAHNGSPSLHEVALPFSVESPAGPVRFLATSVVMQPPTTLQVNVLMPADAESARRYVAFASTLVAGALIESAALPSLR
jgi:transcriptional regulator with XRE-family HTH domain